MSFHHSFDVSIATKYKSVDLAILIHHFQYWINHNIACQRNLIDGRTWTFQTLKDLAAHFPYWSVKQVERLVNKAIKEKILIKGKFNKHKYDQTIWYAFEDENKFTISRNREMVVPKSGTVFLEIGKPIPNNKPDDKPKEEESSPSSGLSAFFFDELKKINPQHKEPDLKKWAKDLDRMIRLDKRNPEEVKEIIVWALNDPFWRKNMLSPEALRKQYDRLWIAKHEKPKAEEVVAKQATQRVDMHKFNLAWFKELFERCRRNNNAIVQLVQFNENCVYLKQDRATCTLGYTEHGFQEQINNFFRLNKWL